MQKKFLCVLMVLLLAMSFVACQRGPQPFREGDQIVLRAGHTVPVDHPYQHGLEFLDRLLNERTNGSLRLEIFPNAQLGGERALFEGAQMGTVDIALGATAPLANFDPAFLVFDLPYLFDSREHAYRVLDGDFGQQKFDGLERFGMVGLAYWEAGFFPIINTRGTMNNLAEASGWNIRVMENEMFMAWITAMGSNPVPMAFGEVFTALQTGIVDGASVSISSIHASGMFTVARYLDLIDAIYSPLPLVISQITWNRLPVSYQAILRQAAIEARDFQRDLITRAEMEYLERMAAAGTVIRQFTPEERRVWQDTVQANVWPNFIGSRVSQADVDAIAGYR